MIFRNGHTDKIVIFPWSAGKVEEKRKKIYRGFYQVGFTSLNLAGKSLPPEQS